MNNNKSSVDIHEIQFYLSRHLDLHPHLSQQYNDEIIELEIKEKVSILPHFKLELYSKHIEEKIKHSPKRQLLENYR